jgi:hypothetical protein
MTSPPGSFGPWSRTAQLRSLAALTAAYELVGELRRAETDEAAAANALQLLDRLPALTRRRLISVFTSITFPPHPRKGSKPRQGRPSIAPREVAATQGTPAASASPRGSYGKGAGK